jgi:hypothetical protein
VAFVLLGKRQRVHEGLRTLPWFWFEKRRQEPQDVRLARNERCQELWHPADRPPGYL